jgi:hypothetical protein
MPPQVLVWQKIGLAKNRLAKIGQTMPKSTGTDQPDQILRLSLVLFDFNSSGRARAINVFLIVA